MQDILFFTIAAILILMLVKGLSEPHFLDVTRTNMGAGNSTIKILLLSDIHARFYFISLKKIEKVIQKEKPDAILFAGDLSSGEKDFDKGIQILSGINSIAKKHSVQIFAVSGNHDPGKLREDLISREIKHLANESAVINGKDGSRWVLAGLEDLREGIPSLKKAISDTPDDLPIIVMAHNPDTLFSIKKDIRDTKREVFLLSGHFHGGQIWMPFGIEYRIMRNERMSKEGYRKGYYERDGIKGYITRGLGCVIFPIRFLSKPEASILTLSNRTPE